jgi:hypothetical protein
VGLDVVYYLGISSDSDAQANEDGDDRPEHVTFSAHGCAMWSKTEEGVIAGVPFRFSEQYEFHVGSYSHYDYWRNQLAEMSGWGSAEALWGEEDVSGPFAELIRYSGSDGTIGTKACAKLHQDFVDWYDTAEAYDESAQPPGYFMEQYDLWLEAFCAAADNGAVVLQ